MRDKFIISIFATALMFLLTQAFALGGEFSDYGGARLFVLGDSGIAMTGDPFASWVNPSLCETDEIQVALSQKDLYGLGMINTDCVLEFPLGDKRYFALSFSQIEYQPLEAKEKIYLLSYAQPINKMFNFGISIVPMSFNSTDPNWSGNGLSMDLGLNMKKDNFLGGVVIRNLWGRKEWNSGFINMPQREVAIGLSGKMDEFSIIGGAIAFDRHNLNSISLGVERAINSKVKLRAGLNTNGEFEVKPSGGFSISVGAWCLDYGVKMDSKLGMTHVLSVTLVPKELGPFSL